MSEERGRAAPATYDLMIGVDPSKKRNAIAAEFSIGGDTYLAHSVLGPIEKLAKWNVLRNLASCCPGRLLAVIEYPDWPAPNIHGNRHSFHGERGNTTDRTRYVRAAAIAFESELQRLFPDRRILKVSPEIWQHKMLAEVDLRRPPRSAGFDERRAFQKARSIRYCLEVLGVDVEGDEDLADAMCILEYGRLIAEGLI